MGKNRNRIANRSAMANGVAAANAVQQVQTDHLASAVSWACKAEFGPALAWLTCGWHIREYTAAALANDKARTGGGGNLSAVRSNAKSIVKGRILEATGGSNLPDVDELIRNYSAYSLLSGNSEPLPSTCEAPWSGFRALGRLVYRKDVDSEGWSFAEVVDVGKAKQVYTDWLTSRPGGARITVPALEGSVNDLLGLAPKVKPEKTASKDATPAQDSGEKQATVIVPGSTVAPNATVNPPAPSEGAKGDNPATATVAAQEAQPAATEAPAPNPNYVPGGEASTVETTALAPSAKERAAQDAAKASVEFEDDDDETEDDEESAPESAEDSKSDLPRPVPVKDHKGQDAIGHGNKPANIAEAFLEKLLDMDGREDLETAQALGKLLAKAHKAGEQIFTSLSEGFIEACQDREVLDSLAELAVSKSEELAAKAKKTATAAA